MTLKTMELEFGWRNVVVSPILDVEAVPVQDGELADRDIQLRPERLRARAAR